MLQCLTIFDLALVESAEVRFDSGLNVLSGETGGGKSLVITALKLLCGERASGSAVRHGCAELRVDGEFVLGSSERSRAVRDLVRERCDFELDEESVLVTRTVDARGRSRVRVGGRPATLATLRELCGFLLEIHAQGDARLMMRPERQSETLDAYGGTGRLRESFAECLARARELEARLTEASGNERERLARAEFLRFQLGELEVLGLVEGETGRLEEEHRVLANLDHMRETLATVIAALQDAEPSAADRLAEAERALQDAAQIDRGLQAAADLVAEARVAVMESGRAVQSRLGDLDLDPARLADVELRLRDVRAALSRFGPTESDLFATRAELASELEAIDGDQALPAALARELDDVLLELGRLGRKLLRARKKIAPTFVAAIEQELGALGMKHTRFDVRQLETLPEGRALLDAVASHGPGDVEFFVQINPGEPFHSMRETASGGEAARIVLAVQKCLADQDRVPFLVFDEIDAEIGGRLGLAVGRKLAEVARDHQLLIVTHLPQVAAFADAHFLVKKEVRGGRTSSIVERLGTDASERELAAMAAGEGADQESLAEARRMVRRARDGAG